MIDRSFTWANRGESYGYCRLLRLQLQLQHPGHGHPQAHCIFLQLHSHLMILALRSTIDGGSEGR